MTRYAVVAVPWALLAGCCALVAGLMSLVAAWPYVMWPLQGTAVGVVAGIVAWSMDERCAAVVDTAPRGLAWRTAARAAVVPPVLGVWLGSLWLMRHRIPDHLGLFAAQGCIAAVVALAVVLHRRAAGVAEPGRAFAAIVVPAATALALTRPLDDRLALFPVWPDDAWELSRGIWAAVAVAAVGTLLVSRAWRR